MSRAALRTPPLDELGASRFPLPLPGWDGVDVTARVPRATTAGLRRRRVGETGTLALAIADREIRPSYVGADRWRTDEQGRLDARGTLGRGRADDPLCLPGTLEVVGRSWALLGGVDARPGSRIEVAGFLVVAEDEPTAAHGTAVALARTWTIRAWRSYVPRGDGLVAVALPALPEPDDADPAAFHVVDLAPR